MKQSLCEDIFKTGTNGFLGLELLYVINSMIEKKIQDIGQDLLEHLFVKESPLLVLVFAYRLPCFCC